MFASTICYFGPQPELLSKHWECLEFASSYLCAFISLYRNLSPSADGGQRMPGVDLDMGDSEMLASEQIMFSDAEIKVSCCLTHSFTLRVTVL